MCCFAFKGLPMNYYHFHIGDYLVDTAHLSIIEDGAYRRLLDRYYTTEQPLSDDESALFRVVRARTEEEKESVRVVLGEFFTLTKEGWTHKRCASEISAYQAKAETNRANGAKGGRPKSEESKPNDNPQETQPEPNDNPQETLTNNQEPITNNQNKKKKENARGRAGFTLETITSCGVPAQVAIDFISHRKTKKAPLNETSWGGIVKEIGKSGLSVAEGLEMCMVRNWQGFKAEWVKETDAQARGTPAQRLTPRQQQMKNIAQLRTAMEAAYDGTQNGRCADGPGAPVLALPGVGA